MTLTNCTVSDNSLSVFFTATGGGLNVYGGTTTLTGCTVSGNSANKGAGLYFRGGTATLSDCMVSGNSALRGGGLFNNGGTTTLTGCTVNGNSADFRGGGLYNVKGTTTLTDCVVSGNSANFGGGGGLYDRQNTTRLTGCVVSGNFAYSYGGGLQNFTFGGVIGATTLTGCIVSGNSAGSNGGGLLDAGVTATLTDCTVSGNSASSGGGLFNDRASKTTLVNCTVSGNSARSSGGGLDNLSGTVTFGNSIVAVNTAGTSGPDAFGTIVSKGNNLVGKTDSSSGWVGSDLTGTIALPLDPMLGPLGDYGGPTQTMALLRQPRHRRGQQRPDPVRRHHDQRGFDRIVNSVVDIGAFETNGIIVKGNIYNDVDGNGFHGGSESGLAGWTVNLLDSTGSVLGSVPADASGNYKFSGVSLGSIYQVAESVPSGWVQTQPLSPTVYSFTAKSGHNPSALNFGDHSAPAWMPWLRSTTVRLGIPRPDRGTLRSAGSMAPAGSPGPCTAARRRRQPPGNSPGYRRATRTPST